MTLCLRSVNIVSRKIIPYKNALRRQAIPHINIVTCKWNDGTCCAIVMHWQCPVQYPHFLSTPLDYIHVQRTLEITGGGS